MKEFQYRGFVVSPVHNYKDGKGDFEYYSLSNCDEGGILAGKTISEVKTYLTWWDVASRPLYRVTTIGPILVGRSPQLHITKFHWIEDAIKFAVKFNGRLETVILNP